MKKFFINKSLALVIISVLMGCFNSCKKEDEGVKTFTLRVQLVYPAGYQAVEGIVVTLNGGVSTVTSNTDASGIAEFEVIAGIYEAMASETRTEDRKYVLFNGVKSGIVVTDAWTDEVVEIDLTESKTSQLVIKELYNGGCQKTDGSGVFQNDQYVILYNNSSETVSLRQLALATTFSSNSNVTNNFLVDGVLTYETEGWQPAAFGLWYFDSDVQLAAGEQIVIALQRAIDNASVEPFGNSINFAKASYYAAYDPTVWSNATYYPAPSEVIPSSHYLKGLKFPGVTSNAFTLSVNSPGFFIFQPAEGRDLVAFVNEADNRTTHGTSASQAALKTPVDWVVDALEVFVKGNANNKKRFPASLDAGYIEFTNQQGYTLYRNVDKTLTEAIPENEGKIVYNYNLGVDESTDPSGIDAEASIKQGARIIYKDTNNSTNDFHLRSRASLRD